MKIGKISIIKALGDAMSTISIIVICVGVIYITFLVSYQLGYNNGAIEAQNKFEQLLAANDIYVSSLGENDQPVVITETVYVTPTPRVIPTWTGPELFEAVNNRRVELGVNPLANNTDLCTIASLRLNELLELGKLDAHEGFLKLSEREEYQRIFQKYNVFEFLLSGADTAQEAVSLWENTQGHSKLLTGGEYVWGCTYAQNGFGVAIAAY